MKILIVDDDVVIRTILRRHLCSWGYEVVEADDGLPAWEILQKERISIVITDWMMAGMDGPQLCGRIREAGWESYIYVILLTARTNMADLVEGMEAGADDFIEKPFQKEELKVRIKAGERILALERDLETKNRELTNSYQVIKRDLDAAAQIQRSLIPERPGILSGYRFDWLYMPSSSVSGDTFNIFRADEDHLCFYVLDVAGHGIPAALLSTTLSRVLSPSQQGGLLKKYTIDGNGYELVAPHEVVRVLNERFESQGESVEYFTIVYGIINCTSGRVVLTQAGHPSPLYFPPTDECREIGDGGFPVGMVSGVDYDEVELVIEPGGRLFVYSDGITECAAAGTSRFFGLAGLTTRLNDCRDLALPDLMMCLKSKLLEFNGSEDFLDDITLLAIERCRE